MIFFKRAFTGIIFTIATTLSLMGQDKPKAIRVSGEITDNKGVPGAFATVRLLQTVDSTLLGGVIADEHGKYIIDLARQESFFVAVSTTGYKTSYSKSLAYTGKDIAVPTIILTPDVTALSEVTVTAKKPFITQETDRMVINVDNSIVSAGATALEVLERAPGVTVDQQNDRLQMRGKSGVIVQIDGKQTYLSEQEVVNLLRNTPSDNIEKIELITNPSSRYDAAGNSGIINIRFKRNKNFGTNGSLSVGAGVSTPDYPRSNASVTVNHREGKLGVFGTLNSLGIAGFSRQHIDRVVPQDDKKTHFDTYSSGNWKGANYSLRTGLDYFVTEKTTVGVLVSSFYNRWKNPNRTTDALMLDNDLQLTQRYRTTAESLSRMANLSGNFYIRHKPMDGKKELTFDVDYVRYDGRGYNALDTRYFKPDSSQASAPEIVRNNMPSLINIGVAKFDYMYSIGKYKIESGLKSSYVASDNNMLFEVKADDWITDNGRTNHFKYAENISALYTSFSGKIGTKTRFMAGLRLEHTYSSGNSVTLNKVNNRNYTDLFPSVFFSRDLDSSNVLNLSYSRRIDRPNYQSLNPFEFYLDPYTFQRGNPNLKPQYTHSLQLTHVFKSFLNTTLAYSRVRDMIAGEVPMLIPEKNMTYLTADNLDTQNYVSLTIGAPVPVLKWWNLQVNLSGAFNEYRTFYRNASYHMQQLTWNAYTNSQFTLPKNWTVEVGGWYNSPSIAGLMVSRPQGMINTGLQKSLNQKKTIIRFNVQDIFQTNRFRGSTRFEDIDLKVNAAWGSRQLRLTVTHRFGNQNIKTARPRNTGSDDLQQRVKDNGNG